jgi:hypothetical protein
MTLHIHTPRSLRGLLVNRLGLDCILSVEPPVHYSLMDRLIENEYSTVQRYSNLPVNDLIFISSNPS